MIRNLRKRRDVLLLLIAVFMSLTIITGVVAAKSVYHGNSKSHIFHASSCRYYDCKSCTVEFSSRGDAIDAGYRPCKVCKP